ncbi:putative methanogenesis marker protein 6 [Candidatus Methanoperedens nitroreducens]|uniref:Putative methanogenesis marker protein 6 n=1 Tax=Candidatus Methanoperedens nitratireducens TaxID=1392998 RepID=A0A062V5S2_9EURY|nr:methanogenesis marker 6 protein [Candidatus Methanoperedens nitroreducens]KCZ72687.1 putative methanogenesis marker protein 6 [Candidatus Methanoperedens nitroreducens]MDJ1423381.1 methanogenesis marker 6 protein [Candidatus Methanoperedens sp.]
MDTITKMIVINSTKVLPSDIVIKLYESNADVMIKETCFGAMVSGERSVVNSLLNDIRKIDPYGIFIKERGLAPGEPYRCRATRRGGARPGFHNLETEDRMLPHIASALRALDRGEVPGHKQRIKKLDVEKLKEIIESEVSQ